MNKETGHLYAVKAESVSRSFGETLAIRDLDLAVERGRIAGVIGPDGAGKSTLLRLLAGLLLPDRGRIDVAGFDTARHPYRVKDRIGYMPQHFSLYGDLTVAENMRFFADYYGVPRPRFEKRKAELLAFSALRPYESRFGRNLSGGMQKKLALSCNLFHEPEILLLDEPTTGVDPVSRREFWRLLEDLHARGTTILFTTPYMDEAARCESVTLLHEGRVLVTDSPESLVRNMRGGIADLAADDLAAAAEFLRGIPGLQSVHRFGESLHIVNDPATVPISEIRRRLDAEGISFTRLEAIPPSFEDVFLALAERSSR
jgi:ABC-2 type transport system ATP-binding protein